MHTPYLITWGEEKTGNIKLEMVGRASLKRRCGLYNIYLFPPDSPRFLADIEKRMSCENDVFRMEEGFMLRYPEPYEPDVRKKEELFHAASISLDGAYSRITIDNGILVIDGSATYLQMLFSYNFNGEFAISNDLPLLEDYLGEKGVKLTPNYDFFASHLAQFPLAYYVFCGTQWNEIDFHDSLETIRFDGRLDISLKNKLSDPAFEALSSSERLDILYKRQRHLVEQFVSWSEVPTITHHLTAGRDSRTSFAFFKESHAGKIVVETGGHPHTSDMVISNYITKIYGIKRTPAAKVTGSGFSYSDLLDTKHSYRQLVAMFRLQRYNTFFNSDRMVATGYLGNSLVYVGSKKRQFLPLEKSPLEKEYHERLEARYDAEISRITAVYGSKFAYRVFHLMYHTANKVSAHFVRLQGFGFCLYESDLFFLSYMLEGEEGMTRQNIHYELMKRADPYLVDSIPFEPGKSFPQSFKTSEITEFKGVKRVGGHRIFLLDNILNVATHIREEQSGLPFLRDGFADDLLAGEGVILSNDYLVNKSYAILGALEFLGRPLKGFRDNRSGQTDEEKPQEGMYDVNFFEKVYLEGAVHTSGLPGTYYSMSGLYRCYWMPPEGCELVVKIVSTPVEVAQKVELTKQGDGFTIKFELDRNSRYRVMHFQKNVKTGASKEVYRTHFVAHTLNQDNAI